jgi:hypothetical protein
MKRGYAALFGERLKFLAIAAKHWVRQNIPCKLVGV